jgi:hypothetical protein
MKTRHEIEVLKSKWLADPVWGIETTPDYQDHAEELLAFRLAIEGRWKAAEQEREAVLDAEADQLGVHGLLRLIRRFEAEQERHKQTIIHLAEGRPNDA